MDSDLEVDFDLGLDFDFDWDFDLGFGSDFDLEAVLDLLYLPLFSFAIYEYFIRCLSFFSFIIIFLLSSSFSRYVYISLCINIGTSSLSFEIPDEPLCCIRLIGAYYPYFVLYILLYILSMYSSLYII